MRPLVLLTSFITAAAFCGCAATHTDRVEALHGSPLAGLDWMLGSWTGEQNGVLKQEHWITSGGDAMFGVAPDVNDRKTTFFEYLRIEGRPEGIFYLASPKGRYPPTEFKMIEAPTPDRPHAVFENPDHDFPQRITYWRDGQTLHARIEGNHGGERAQQEFAWRRATR